MTSVRNIAVLALLGIVLTMPGLAMANDGKSRSAAPARIESSGPESPPSDARSKFIYLDDGSGGNSDDNSALSNVPARPIFRLETKRSRDEAQQLGVLSRKRPVLVLDPQIAPALTTGIRVDGFGATADQRSTLQIQTAGDKGGRKSGSKRDNLDIWVITETSRSSSSRTVDLALDPRTARPSSSVGVNLGYHGFTVGAGFLREKNGIDLSYQGYDLGIGYLGRSWYTNLQVADFRNESNPLYYNFMGDRFRAVELGAGYIIWPGFTFSGRFKYFDYGSPLFTGGQGEDQHIFSLDTRLNF